MYVFTIDIYFHTINVFCLIKLMNLHEISLCSSFSLNLIHIYLKIKL